MRDDLRDRLLQFPRAPGVYLMKSTDGEIFYIGKAKDLRARVKSYLNGVDTRAFVALLDTLLDDVEIVLTNNEKEALLLEDQLVKRHQPRFNVKLVDDKRFLRLRLDPRETYPRLRVVRRFSRDGARYFGPYHSAHAIRETLRIVNRHFGLRTCSDRVMRSRHKPCLQHQIKRCPAPCVFDLSNGSYGDTVLDVVAFLEGRQSQLIDTLEAKMRRLAADLLFEQAAKVRDQIKAVRRSLERQGLVSPQAINRDVIGIHREGSELEIHVMRTRDGKPVDAHRYALTQMEAPTSELLTDFAMQYYGDIAEIPTEILFSTDIHWHDVLAQVLSEKAGRKVRVAIPQRGEKRTMAVLAARNAEQTFASSRRRAIAAQGAVLRLQRRLHLRQAPEILECFDISHLGGTDIVASAVRFEQGEPRKDGYRYYKVRSLEGQDDFAAMYEILSRRARRGLEEGDLPHLIVIDGGKGQLNAARAALEDHGIDDVDLIGLAKARPLGPKSTIAQQEYSAERVFVLGQKKPVVLRQDSAELFLLTRARDEAHRFAVGFQRKARGKRMSHSELDDISGVGPKKRAALLRTFGSVAKIRQTALAEVAAVVGEKTARAIWDGLVDGDKLD